MEQFGYDLVELIRQVIADHDGQVIADRGGEVIADRAGQGIAAKQPTGGSNPPTGSGPIASKPALSPQDASAQRVPLPPPRLDPAIAKSLPGISSSPASRSADGRKGQSPDTKSTISKQPDPKLVQTSVQTPTESQPRIPGVAPNTTADAYWTWKMLRDGYPWHDVAAIRRATPRQLLDDLFTVSMAGHPVNPDWVDDASLRAELAERMRRK